jgi:hypothetical protein
MPVDPAGHQYMPTLKFGITLAELATVFEARPGLDRQRPRRPTDHQLRGHHPGYPGRGDSDL